AVPDHHARAVSRGRGPAVRIRWIRWFNDGKLDGPHPKLFARPSVKAVQVSLLARVFRTSDKDAPMRNDGAAVTRTWECRFPSDVIRRSPMERRFLLLSDTIPESPAKLRPIPCRPKVAYGATEQMTAGVDNSVVRSGPDGRTGPSCALAQGSKSPVDHSLF